MIKHYTFDYDMKEAEASFKVDTDIFDEEAAQLTLDFFSWEEPYDKEANPIDEVMKKYAIQAIMFATSNYHNTQGVTGDFNDEEGWAAVDGSVGIELMTVSSYEFMSDRLDMTVVED